MVMMFLLKNTKHNILISALFHFSINIGFGIYFTEGFENIKLFLINSSVWLIAAIIIVLCRKKYYFIKEKYV